jgi:hypothetical protein
VRIRRLGTLIMLLFHPQHGEYALGCASGDLIDGRKPGLCPAIMFACSVAMAYPTTRGADYAPASNQFSDYLGSPLKLGFDCNVVCVSAASGFQAVGRDQCEYVEVIIEQESWMLRGRPLVRRKLV